MSPGSRRPVALADRYERREGEIHLSGLQALVRIPIEQFQIDQADGRQVATLIAGYEGSPLAGLDLELARNRDLLAAHGVVHRPGVNEELAATAVQGSQLASASERRTTDGVVGIWYGKAPGLDRATDALRHGNLGGADGDGGVLVLVGDDSTAKSSTVPSSSEVAMGEIGMVVLAPADPAEIIEYGLHGIALSRFCGLWAGLKLATNLVDGSATTRIRVDRPRPVIPDRTVDGAEYRHRVSAQFLQPELAVLERSAVHDRMELARRFGAANSLDRVVGDPAATVGVVVAGTPYLDVLSALDRIGIAFDALPNSGVRILKLGTVSPVDVDTVRRFAGGLREIIVVEEKRPFVELAVKDALYGTATAPAVSGRRTPDGQLLLRAHADLPPEHIAAVLAQRILAHIEIESIRAWVDARSNVPAPRTVLPLAARTPYFCSGCPHNRSMEVPAGSLVGAGIGCSGLASLMDPARVGDVVGFTQMGGEGASWIGMSPFVSTPHFFQNLGDGTYHHSGSLAVRASVAAGVRMTYKLLYNGAVAMTGGQAPVGRLSVLDLAAELMLEGVREVVITTENPGRYRRTRRPKGVSVRPRSDLVEVQTRLAGIDGVTVLIHDQECATELRRKRKRGMVARPTSRLFINERVCEGCGDCGRKSNCLSVRSVPTEYGEKTQIHQESCNVDLSCLDGDCPSFVSVVPGRRRPDRNSVAAKVGGDLPAPRPAVADGGDFNVRITGIGGTGIVTMAQVLATAATLSGRYVQGMDQLGLAQKGGAVVSDLRISTEPIHRSNKLGSAECDLYLGCDLLVAAATANLECATPSRTSAIVSTSQIPTGAMVSHVEQKFPDVDAVLAPIRAASHPERSLMVDAQRESLDRFGDDQFANIVVLGLAVQTGYLPIEPEYGEQALTLNGVQVERNIEAFNWGRRLAEPAGRTRADDGTTPEAVIPAGTAEIAGIVRSEPGSELAALVLDRVAELIRYQNRAYARNYTTAVESVRSRESQTDGVTGAVALTYARYLYKLMAYKDEYEVARLCLDPALADQVRAAFGPDARLRYRLHPPVLRALGMQRKISLGRGSRPVLRILYGLRVARGRWFDPFGHTDMRRQERALIAEYRQAMERAMAIASTADLAVALELAALPDDVRGYESLKLRAIEAFRDRSARLLAELDDRSVAN